LSLLSQKAIKLQYMTASRVFLGMSFFVGREFALAPGDNPAAVKVTGDLEKRIVRAVSEWWGRTDRYVRFNRRNFRHRTFAHLLTLDDLVFIVFEGQMQSRAERLVLGLVQEDAGQQGLGRLEGGWRGKFELVPEYQDRMRAEYAVIYKTHEALKTLQPDMIPELALAIERAIRLLETDTD
jgi:hypothetical protein